MESIVAIREYLKGLDAGDPAAALAMMDENLTFLFALPSGPVMGTSRADYADYIASRAAPADRVHDIARFAVDGDLELVYGWVVEGGTSVGAFMSAAWVSPHNRILRYQSFFDPTYSLLDRQES